MFAGILSGPTDEPAARPHPPNIGDCEQVRLAGNAITPLAARDLISAVVEAAADLSPLYPSSPEVLSSTGFLDQHSRAPTEPTPRYPHHRSPAQRRLQAALVRTAATSDR
jgi:hypothetical protein